MDLCRDKGSVCACHPVSYQANTLQRLLMPTKETYSSCGSQGMSTQTYYESMNQSNYNHYMNSAPKQNTLQSVLMGEIPAAYSHLTTPRMSSSSSSTFPAQTLSNASLRIPSPYDTMTPSPHSPAPHQSISPPFIPYSSHHDMTPPHSPSPSHMKPTREVHSPHYVQQFIQREEILHQNNFIPSASPPNLEYDSCQDQPIDLSCKSPQHEDIPHEGIEENFSMLRNLLCVGKSLHSEHEQSPVSSEQEDSSYFEQYSTMTIKGTTRVTLAKKNMLPVSSRVSDWLVKIVQFAKSIPEFQSLSHNDKVTLILNSWTRLLLLYMAESNFLYVVTPRSCESDEENVTPAPDEPTMKSSDSIQNFIKKCQGMNLDQKEYTFLRMAVLFNAGYVGLDRPDLVDQLNSLIQQLLQQHVRSSRPDDVMHYSRLLLCLPTLYGINCKMIENLFCRHINGNMDLDVLLKEMLQNL